MRKFLQIMCLSLIGMGSVLGTTSTSPTLKTMMKDIDSKINTGKITPFAAIEMFEELSTIASKIECAEKYIRAVDNQDLRCFQGLDPNEKDNIFRSFEASRADKANHMKGFSNQVLLQAYFLTKRISQEIDYRCTKNSTPPSKKSLFSRSTQSEAPISPAIVLWQIAADTQFVASIIRDYFGIDRNDPDYLNFFQAIVAILTSLAKSFDDGRISGILSPLLQDTISSCSVITLYDAHPKQKITDNYKKYMSPPVNDEPVIYKIDLSILTFINNIYQLQQARGQLRAGIAEPYFKLFLQCPYQSYVFERKHPYIILEKLEIERLKREGPLNQIQRNISGKIVDARNEPSVYKEAEDIISMGQFKKEISTVEQQYPHMPFPNCPKDVVIAMALNIKKELKKLDKEFQKKRISKEDLGRNLAQYTLNSIEPPAIELANKFIELMQNGYNPEKSFEVWKEYISEEDFSRLQADKTVNKEPSKKGSKKCSKTDTVSCLSTDVICFAIVAYNCSHIFNPEYEKLFRDGVALQGEINRINSRHSEVLSFVYENSVQDILSTHPENINSLFPGNDLTALSSIANFDDESVENWSDLPLVPQMGHTQKNSETPKDSEIIKLEE